jgi:hypothetical protein
MNQMVVIASDVLKHTSVFFFQGTVNFRFYRKIYSIYNNSSWIPYRYSYLEIAFFVLVIKKP